MVLPGVAAGAGAAMLGADYLGQPTPTNNLAPQ
jgi:hypothetical protein